MSARCSALSLAPNRTISSSISVQRCRAHRALGQARRSGGCLAADGRMQSGRVFWTRTLWRDVGTMRDYMKTAAHRGAMLRLPSWCDEASVVHWDYDGALLPDWQ